MLPGISPLTKGGEPNSAKPPATVSHLNKFFELDHSAALDTSATSNIAGLTQGSHVLPKKKSEKFNFDYIKILIADKNGKNDTRKEVLLSRKWI